MKIYKVTFTDESEKVDKVGFVKAFNTRDALFTVNNELKNMYNEEFLYKNIEEIAVGNHTQIFHWQNI